MTRALITLVAVLSLCAMWGAAQDWLEGGYVGSPNYGDVRQYFTEPIFYTRPPAQGVYTPIYQGEALWREPVMLGRYVVRPIGTWTTTPVGEIYPSTPWESDFRSRSLAALGTGTSAQNWTETVSSARGRSSVRIYEGGAWRPI